MKRFAKSILGVTLLEIMLVLAIAAMVIVMSVRYYQTAQLSSQTNTFISQIQGLTAAVENLSQNAGYDAASKTALESILPGGTNVWFQPWGGSMVYASGTTGYTVTLTPPPAGNLCTMITAKFSGLSKFTVGASCADVTYDSSK